MLSASKHADVLSKEEYDIGFDTNKHLSSPPPKHTSTSTPAPQSPHTPQSPTLPALHTPHYPPPHTAQKAAREPTAYNLFVSSLPPKTPNRFVYAAQAWKELPPAEKERMRAFLVQHTHELRDIHPDVRQRFRAITQLWLLAKN